MLLRLFWASPPSYFTSPLHWQQLTSLALWLFCLWPFGFWQSSEKCPNNHPLLQRQSHASRLSVRVGCLAFPSGLLDDPSMHIQMHLVMTGWQLFSHFFLFICGCKFVFLYSFTQILNPSYICGSVNDARSKSNDCFSYWCWWWSVCRVLLQFLLSGEQEDCWGWWLGDVLPQSDVLLRWDSTAVMWMDCHDSFSHGTSKQEMFLGWKDLVMDLIWSTSRYPGVALP